MAINLFGVDAESVRKHHFPHFDAFSIGGRMSLASVTEAISEEAAKLAGKLSLEAIDASSIITNSPAYLQCRAALRLCVAVRLVRDIPGIDSELAKAWRAELRDFFEGLDEGGDTFLGEGAVSTSTSDPDGPTDFISEMGLEVGSDDDASDVIPTLRRKDEL